jgi:hypothetical protein
MEVDINVFDPPGGELLKGVAEKGAIPNRHKRFGGGECHRTETFAETCAKKKGFCGCHRRRP